MHKREDIKVDYGDGFILSEEQIDITESMNIKKENVCISAKSGSGKSTTLQLALRDKTNTAKTGLFLAFNNKIAKEAKEDNPSWIQTSTIHSLSYKYIVAPNRLKLRNRIDFKDFSSLSYRHRSTAVKCINKYCQSDVIKVSDFCEDKHIADAVKDVMSKMLHGELPITHDAYLKWFSLYLQLNMIEPEEVDIIIADEYQDFNDAMASIFLLYPAKQRVAVGDQDQQINGFMGSSDAIQKLMLNTDFRVLGLTSTQRCTPEMASVAQSFCRKYIKSDFVYVGKNTNKETRNDFIYMTRTNSELIELVPYLQSMGIMFNTTRKVDIIYHVYLMIQFNAKKEYNFYKEHNRNSDKFKKEDIRFVEVYSAYVKDEAVRMQVANRLTDEESAKDMLSMSIRESYMDYFSTDRTYCSFAMWISMQDLLFEHQDMYMTSKAILGLANNKVNIYESYKYAKEMEKSRDKYTLTISTAHAAKGLTKDIAYFSNGINTALEKEINHNESLIKEDRSLAKEDPSDQSNGLKVEIANLYYMAFTRARFRTGNAKYITDDKHYPGSEMHEQDFMRMVVDSQKENMIQI